MFFSPGNSRSQQTITNSHFPQKWTSRSQRTKQPSKQKLFEKRRTIEENVERILKLKPPTRGDDTLLLIYYLHYFVPNRIVKVSFNQKIVITINSFKDIFYIPCFETIRRTRQKLQALNPKLNPTARVRKKREINEEAHREYYGLSNYWGK